MPRERWCPCEYQVAAECAAVSGEPVGAALGTSEYPSQPRCLAPLRPLWLRRGRVPVARTRRPARTGRASRVVSVMQDGGQFMVEFSEGLAQRRLQPWIGTGPEVAAEAEDRPRRKMPDAVPREHEPQHEKSRAEHHWEAADVKVKCKSRRRTPLLSMSRADAKGRTARQRVGRCIVPSTRGRMIVTFG